MDGGCGVRRVHGDTIVSSLPKWRTETPGNFSVRETFSGWVLFGREEEGGTVAALVCGTRRSGCHWIRGMIS
jgi:hypothetical protein